MGWGAHVLLTGVHAILESAQLTHSPTIVCDLWVIQIREGEVGGTSGFSSTRRQTR